MRKLGEEKINFCCWTLRLTSPAHFGWTGNGQKNFFWIFVIRILKIILTRVENGFQVEDLDEIREIGTIFTENGQFWPYTPVFFLLTPAYYRGSVRST